MPHFMDFDEIVAETKFFDKGYWYVATPYAKYPFGRYTAFVHAAKIAGKLVAAGVPVMSPIAHSHPLALYGGINSTDHRFWLDFDRHFMDPAVGCIVACMRGWDESEGIKEEVEFFELMRRPVLYLTVSDMICSWCHDHRLLQLNGKFYHELEGVLFECEAA